MATTQQDVIKKFMASLDTTTKSGTAALDEAITACTDSKYTTIQSVIDKMVADCKSTNNSTKFLKDYCGIDLTNEDTGAITGLDAGGSKSKNAEDIVPEVGSLQTCASNSFTKNGVTFSLSESYNSLTAAQKYMWNGLYTWWVDGAFDLIAESYGSNYSLQSGTNMKVEFVNDSDFLAAAPFAAYYNGECYPTGLEISLTYYSNINTSNPNGVSTNYGYQDTYLDRVLAHEFTHSVMAANIKYMNKLPQFIAEGMAELTHGIDDERTSTIKSLAGNSTSLKNALNVSDIGTGTEPAYAGGYMFLRYLAKQFADSTSTEETVSGPFTENADYYENTTANTILSALGGNDTVKNSASNVQIYGNAGNDSIKNLSNYVTMDGGAGNDSLENWDGLNSYVTIYGGAGNDFIRNGGSRVFISMDDGADYAYSWTDYTTILSGAGNDSVDITGNYATVDGGTGRDSLYSQGSNNSVSGGDDNDLLYSYDKYNLFDGGTGNDSLSTSASNNTLKGGAGDDSIHYVHGGSNLVMGEAGNDTVNIWASNNTVIGGTDNDIVSLSSSASNGVIQYASGDGNDTVYGFKTSDTLDVSGAKYSTVKSGNDLVVKVGSGSVLLKDVATLSSAKINGILDSGSSNIFTEGADNYTNTSANTVLSALGGNDTVDNRAANVQIYGNAGNDKLYNSSDQINVTLDGGEGSDLLFNNGDKVLLNGGAGSDNIQNVVTNDNGIRYTERVTINGGDGGDYIWHWGNKSFVDGGTGNDSIRSGGNPNNGGDDLTVKGGTGNDTIIADGKRAFINGGTDNDIVSLTSSASNGVIQYASGDGNDTVYGFKTSDTLDVSGAKYSTVKSGNDLVVKVGSGSVLLKNAATLSSAKINGTLDSGSSSTSIFTEGDDRYTNDTANTVLSALGGNDDVFNSASNVQIYGNAGNDFLSNANGKNVIGGNNVTLDGGAGNDTLYNNGNNILLLGGDGNDNIQNIATIGEGTTMNQVTVNGGKGDDVINITPYAKYARNNVVQYASGDGNDTVGSFDSHDMLHITSGSISKTSVSGNNFIVYVGDGRITFRNFADKILTVKLANGTVTTLRAGSGTETEETASWKISGTTATYGTNSKTLVTVNGINKNATADDFSLDEKTVTLSANALGTSKVTISNGYTLALASDVATPSETSTSWQILETSATLFSGTSAGYILSDDKKSITYSKEKNDKILAVIRGINQNATADSFSVEGNTITLSKSVLNKNREITISGDYDLALATDVTKSETVSAGWSVKNTTATYQTAGVSEGYVLSDDKKTISYTSKTKSKTAVTLKGLKSGLKSSNGKISGITLNNKNVKLSTKVLGKEGASVSGGGYTFILGGKGLLKNVGAAATFKGSSKNDTLIGGKGNDSILGNSGNDKLLGGAGNDSILGGAGNDSLTGGNGNDTLSGGKGNDSILGNSGNDKLLGGAGNDTLTGGKGNDTLTGGKGKDIFVYTKSTGNDVITDYTAGTDKIKISSGSISKVTYNKKDVIFKIGNGTLTVKNGKGKKISIITSIKTYSGSKNSNISELWFAEENNFVSTDNIDSITKNNLTPTALEKITTTNYENLTQDNLITFTDK